MIWQPEVHSYYGTNLVGTDADIHDNRECWSFGIGGRMPTRITKRLLEEWLLANKFFGEIHLLQVCHEYGPIKVWLDFFDGSDAMRFRLMYPIRQSTNLSD